MLCRVSILLTSAMLLTTPPVYAASLFGFHPLRHMIEHKARTTAEVTAGVVAVGLLSAHEVLSMTLATNCTSDECGPSAVDEVMAFLSKHRVAGHSEMAHAMKKEAEANPEKIPAIADLAKKTGVKFAGDNMKPPGDCNQDDYDRFVENVEKACGGGKNEDGTYILQPEKCKITDQKNIPGHMGKWQSSLAAFEQCHIARKEIMNKCFRGGDTPHRTQLDGVAGAIKNCNNLIDRANKIINGMGR